MNKNILYIQNFEIFTHNVILKFSPIPCTHRPPIPRTIHIKPPSKKPAPHHLDSPSPPFIRRQTFFRSSSRDPLSTSLFHTQPCEFLTKILQKASRLFLWIRFSLSLTRSRSGGRQRRVMFADTLCLSAAPPLARARRAIFDFRCRAQLQEGLSARCIGG